MGGLGGVIFAATQVELAMELAMKRHMGLSTRHACIVFGPMAGGAKTNMLSALAEENTALSELHDAVKKFEGVAGRNHYAHGVGTYENPKDEWAVIHRKVKDGLKIKTRVIADLYKGNALQNAMDAVLRASGLTAQELHDYTREIEALA